MWTELTIELVSSVVFDAQASVFPSPNLILVVVCYACGLLHVIPDITLESPVQKTRGFAVQIALPRWFFERAHQEFGEMTERI
jgi:hypothetical protein